MRSFSSMFSFVAFSLAAVQAANAGPCDQAWSGIGLSVAASPNGHLAAVRGNDGKIRVAEWSQTSSSWGAWTTLSGTDQIVSEPWVEVNTGAYQNIFARTNDSVIQWIGSWNGGSVSFVRTGISNNGNSFTGRVAVATGDGQAARPTAFMFAKATNGTLKMWEWNGYSQVDWTDMGLSNVSGSPSVEQVSPTNFNVFVRLGGGTIMQNNYDAGVWSGWMTVSDAGSGDVAVAHTDYPYFYSVSNESKVFSFAWNGNGFTSPVDVSFPGYQNLSAVAVSPSTAFLYGRDAFGNVWRATRVNGQALTNKAMVNCATP